MISLISSEKDNAIYERSMNELDEFFGLGWKKNRPRVFLVPDRKTINKLRGEEVGDWVVGWLCGRDVYVLDRENYEAESCHKYSEDAYAALIKHELSHAFFYVLSNFNSKPKWLWEGVAVYLSGQNATKKKPVEFNEFLDYHNHGGKGVYRESGFALEFLVENYGGERLLELIKSLDDRDSKEEFARKFEGIYGFKLNYREFIQ